MINPIVYADLKRILKKLRCDGESEADILLDVAEMLKYGVFEEEEC